MPLEPSQNGDREKRWLEPLIAAFTADGWSTKSEVHIPGPESRQHVDLIARKGTRTYVIEVKAARDGRSAALTSLAAAGLLQARRFASLVSGTPMVIVAAPRLSPSLIDTLRRFIVDFGDNAPWGVIDESGLLELHGPDLDRVKAVIPKPWAKAPRSATASPIRGQSDPFSDLSQWCLKLLLSHLLPAELQLVSRGLPIGRPIRNANELAKLAGVSAPTAWRTVRALQESGLINRSEPLVPLRREELLTRWQATNLRPGPDIRARWLFSSRTSALERLCHELQTLAGGLGTASTPYPRRALGLFAAAEVLGHGFVRGVSPHLLHENPSVDELERLGLTTAGPGERTDVFVRKPRFPEAVFRGVASMDRVPVTDIFQIWLDVSAHPARGREMAEHLASRVLSRVISSTEEPDDDDDDDDIDDAEDPDDRVNVDEADE